MEINLENVGKSYAKKQIFQNVNFKFETNQRYGISGHNGSGKSTLLKIISGFVTPSSGQISYKLNESDIDIADVYQYISYNAPYIEIPMDMTWSELLKFHFSIKSRYELTTNDTIHSLINLPLDLPLHQFSSGMIQRAKLALGFFTDTRLLLLDEPTETLDESGAKLFGTLLELYSKNRTVIIASNKATDFIDCKETISILDYIR